MYRGQFQPDRHRPLSRDRVPVERRDLPRGQSRTIAIRRNRPLRPSRSRAAAMPPRRRGPSWKPANSTTPGTCSSLRRCCKVCWQRAREALVSSFGTLVERLVVNLTDPAPGAGRRTLHPRPSAPVSVGPRRPQGPVDGHRPRSFSSRSATARPDGRPAISFRHRQIYASSANEDCLRAGHRRRKAFARRGRLAAGAGRHTAEGRHTAFDPVPDLDQRGSAGHSRL